jgi:S1-C subfamily serine protease
MMKRFPLVVILTVLFNVTAAQAGQLKPDEKRALEAKPAVALVVVQFQTKWTLGEFSVKLPHGAIGTGFFFRPDGYLITNGHVVKIANMKDPQAEKARQDELRKDFLTNLQAVVKMIEKQIGRSVTDKEVIQLAQKGNISLVAPPTLTLVLANGKTVTADILQYSDPLTENGKDVAILKAPGSNYPTVPLGNSDTVRLQDSVMVMGFPGVAYSWGDNPLVSAESNFESSATNGHISAVRTGATGAPLLQSDVAITHGNSGGPAFNDQGQVIGIATAGANVQGFNFLVPINTALEFVHQTGVQGEAGAFNDHWYQALAFFDAGQFRKSITEFDNVLQFMPDLPDAKKYRASAVVAEDHLSALQKLVETTGTLPLYAGVLVLLLAAAAVIFLRKPAHRMQPTTARTASAGSSSSVTKTALESASAARAVPPTRSESGYGSVQFISGPLSGRTYKISKEGFWIGRDPRCGAVLTDDTVSAEHAWIVPVDGFVMVIDKGSSNGTYVNSVDSPRVSKISLKDGDKIFIGKKGAVATYFAA